MHLNEWFRKHLTSVLTDCIFMLPSVQVLFERGKIQNHYQIGFSRGTIDYVKLKVGMWENRQLLSNLF